MDKEKIGKVEFAVSSDRLKLEIYTPVFHDYDMLLMGLKADILQILNKFLSEKREMEPMID
jgi:hypothetical protein